MVVVVATVTFKVVVATVVVAATWGAVLVQVLRGTGTLLEQAVFAGG